MDVQLRVGLDSSFGIGAGYRWEVVAVRPGQEVREVLASGEAPGLISACVDGGAEVQRILANRGVPAPPVGTEDGLSPFEQRLASGPASRDSRIDASAFLAEYPTPTQEQLAHFLDMTRGRFHALVDVAREFENMHPLTREMAVALGWPELKWDALVRLRAALSRVGP